MRFPVFLLFLLPLAAAWSYDNPNQWVKEFPACGGSHQSPIAIESNDLVKADLPALKLQHYDEAFDELLRITNFGHTIGFKVPKTKSGSKPIISGGPLKGNYTAETLSLHWGSPTSQGSEHQIDGTRYPLEMQIVHKNSKYATINEAYKHEDGLAVIAVLIQYAMYPTVKTPGLDDIWDTMNFLRRYKFEMYPFDRSLVSFLGQVDDQPYITGGDEFITYSGSLTTPPCAESVTWIVFKKLLPVNPFSAYEILKTQQQNGKTLNNNFRPVQPIGDRKVYLRGA